MSARLNMDAKAFRRSLRLLEPRVQTRNLNNATSEGGRFIRENIRSQVDRIPGNMRTLRRAIRMRVRRRRGNVFLREIEITHGSSARNDAWYWHFFERGTQTRTMSPAPVLRFRRGSELVYVRGADNVYTLPAIPAYGYIRRGLKKSESGTIVVIARRIERDILSQAR